MLGMYEQHYGFSAKPFKLTPDSEFYFPSEQHQRAMAFLQYGVQQADGFIVITGEVGAGKTTLVRTLLQRLEDPSLQIANIVSSQLQDSEILQLVALKLGYKVKDNPSKVALLNGLQTAFTQQGQQGGRSLLIVDEAQNLSPGSLEELRMLSNFQLDGSALVQIFLVGQPEFRETLLAPSFEQLRQRVIASHHLSAMTAQETQAYVEHRLSVVGWSGQPAFEEDAFGAIHNMTSGLPRRINNLMDRTLLACFLDEEELIAAHRIWQIAQEIETELKAGLAAEAQSIAMQTPLDSSPLPLQAQAVKVDKANPKLNYASSDGAYLDPPVDRERSSFEADVDALEQRIDEAMALLQEARLLLRQRALDPTAPTVEVS